MSTEDESGGTKSGYSSENEVIFKNKFDYSPDEKQIALFSDVTYIPDKDDEETVLVTTMRPKIPFLRSEAMLENYFGVSIFFIILGFSFIDVNLTFVSNWVNVSQLLLEQDAVGYPVLITITVFMIVVQQQLLQRKKFLIFYFIIFPLIFVADIIGNYKNMQRNGFGSAIWCMLFGISYRFIFDLTKTIHRIDINRLQNLVLNYENFVRISIVIISVDFLDTGMYLLKTLIISWVLPLFIIFFILIIGRKIMVDEIALIVGVGVATVGPFAASVTGNLIGMDRNMTRKITAIMMFYLIFNVNCVPLISFGLKLNNITEAAWIANSVDSVGGALASASLGSSVDYYDNIDSNSTLDNISVLQGTLITKLLQMLILGPVYVIIEKLYYKRASNYSVLWTLFPKFIFGFLVTNIITITLPEEVRELTIINCYSISQWFLKMGLVMIGFDVNLKVVLLFKEYWRLFVLIIVAKIIDISVGLAVAYPLYTLWK